MKFRKIKLRCRFVAKYNECIYSSDHNTWKMINIFFIFSQQKHQFKPHWKVSFWKNFVWWIYCSNESLLRAEGSCTVIMNEVELICFKLTIRYTRLNKVLNQKSMIRIFINRNCVTHRSLCFDLELKADKQIQELQKDDKTISLRYRHIRVYTKEKNTYFIEMS